MAGLQLTRGDESRLEGAPYQDLPNYAAYIDAVAARILEDDKEGLLGNDEGLAREQARVIVDAELDALRRKSAQRQAAVTEQHRNRLKDRAQARGVDPETMPYGASASDVRLANRPVDEVTAQLEREQDAADRVVRGLREGTPTFEAQEDLNFIRERGAGESDMAMRARIRERQGQYFEMPDGSRIPVGREPTAAEIRAEREWQEWVNSQPGSERQALYDPAAYENYREGVRQSIQDRARQEIAKYGGTDATKWTDEQKKNRDQRAAEESLRRNAPRAVAMRRMRLEEAAGLDPALAQGMTEDQLRVEASRARLREKQGRRALVAGQAMMAGGQPTGGPFGTRATTTAINQLGPGWREIALLDRLTQGRVGGPTPLGVEQFQAQAIAQGVGRALTGALANINPQAAEVMSRQRDMALRQKAGAAKHAAWEGSQKTDAVKAMEKEGATKAEIDTIMTDLFGPNWSEDMIDARPEKAEAVRKAAAGVLEALPPGV